MKTFIAALILAIVIVVVSVFAANESHASPLTPQRIIKLTNQNRATPVVEDQQLNRAAQAKAQALAQCQCFSHTLPDGRTPWSFLTGINYMTAGENLAVDFNRSEPLMKAWMNSPGHRANIVNPAFHRTGIGIAEGKYQGHKTKFIVQFFSN
jgi:uncharacterized protein YkwD